MATSLAYTKPPFLFLGFSTFLMLPLFCGIETGTILHPFSILKATTLHVRSLSDCEAWTLFEWIRFLLRYWKTCYIETGTTYAIKIFNNSSLHILNFYICCTIYRVTYLGSGLLSILVAVFLDPINTTRSDPLAVWNRHAKSASITNFDFQFKVFFVYSAFVRHDMAG